VFPASRPSRGVVSYVTLGLPGHPPKGAVPRYPPRGVLRDWSRPISGSCRGVVSPLTGCFPHTTDEPQTPTATAAGAASGIHLSDAWRTGHPPSPTRRRVPSHAFSEPPKSTSADFPALRARRRPPRRPLSRAPPALRPPSPPSPPPTHSAALSVPPSGLTLRPPASPPPVSRRPSQPRPPPLSSAVLSVPLRAPLADRRPRRLPRRDGCRSHDRSRSRAPLSHFLPRPPSPTDGPASILITTVIPAAAA